VFVVSEYNHGYSAVLKNDWTTRSSSGTASPSRSSDTEASAGAHAIEQLREVVVELEMAPLRHAVHILPELMRPAMAEGSDPEVFASLDERLDVLAEDLAWWACTLAAGRASE
jgi:NAD(P)H-dependent FMN reductase